LLFEALTFIPVKQENTIRLKGQEEKHVAYFDKQRQSPKKGLYDLPYHAPNVNWKASILPSMQQVRQTMILEEEENILVRIASYHCTKRDTQPDI
jgi:hypothetical protein